MKLGESPVPFIGQDVLNLALPAEIQALFTVWLMGQHGHGLTNELQAIAEHCAALPVRDPRAIDEILGPESAHAASATFEAHHVLDLVGLEAEQHRSDRAGDHRDVEQFLDDAFDAQVMQ